jgi:fumarate hydratase class II
MEYRMERDSMGEMRVPAQAMYGAQTARAVENFPISSLRLQRKFIWALGLIKKHAAQANAELGMAREVADAVARAAAEVQEGKWDSEFVVDVYQTGSGTSTNMNANEVISRRAGELLGQAGKIHPNDHVNRGQSSNDVIPTALHISALAGITQDLLPAMERLESALTTKAKDFETILKIGRTHLQDATPMTLGQEFSGYASQMTHGVARLRNAQPHLAELALGGTAVGTGINTHHAFAAKTIKSISAETGLPFREAQNHFEAQGGRDAAVEAGAALKTVAVSLVKIANDIRFLGSGPRLGYGELLLPATQPGSSIMPGKVNPVMCEMLIQVCAQVFGADAVVTFSGAFGNFELNVMIPVIAWNLLHSIEILTSGINTFSSRCVEGLTANREKCESNIEQSLAMCTALAPLIGYDQAAAIAKKAHQTQRSVREVAYESSGLSKEVLDKALDPWGQIRSA